MNPARVTVAVVVCLLAQARLALGQDTAADARLAASVAAAQRQYADSFIGNPQLFNGPEYVDYGLRYRNRTGHQFFLSPDKQNGSVFYNGHYFAQVRLAYDVVRDQVVMPQPTSPLTFRLINERVRAFTLGEHRFVRLVADSSAGNAIRTGYYEVLVDGPVRVVAKRTKYLQERVIRGGVDVEFTSANKLFVQKAGAYYPVNNKGAAVRLFADRGQEVQQYIQGQRLKFRKAQFEDATVQLARYYSTLPVQ